MTIQETDRTLRMQELVAEYRVRHAETRSERIAREKRNSKRADKLETLRRKTIRGIKYNKGA